MHHLTKIVSPFFVYCYLVMISYGGVLGKVTPMQMLILAVVEPIFFWLNIFIGVEKLKAVDVGGGMLQLLLELDFCFFTRVYLNFLCVLVLRVCMHVLVCLWTEEVCCNYFLISVWNMQAV